MGSIFDGIAGAVLSAGGGIIGNIMNRNAIREQNKANKDLAKYQFNLNMQAWNAQNQYNSPAAQVARLKAAGLNPQLAYGSGSNAGNASSVPQYEAPHMEAYQGNAKDMAQIMNLMPIAQLNQLTAQTRLIDAQTAKEKQLAKEVGERTKGMEYDNTYKKAKSGYAGNLASLEYLMKQNDYAMQGLNMRLINHQININSADEAIKNIQKIYADRMAQAELEVLKKRAENLGASTAHFNQLVEQIKILTPTQKEKLLAEIGSLNQNININLPVEKMAEELGISPQMASFLKIIVSIFK